MLSAILGKAFGNFEERKKMDEKLVLIFIWPKIMLTSSLTPAIKNRRSPAMPEQLIKTKHVARPLNGAHTECTGHFQCTPCICNSCFLIGLSPHSVWIVNSYQRVTHFGLRLNSYQRVYNCFESEFIELYFI